MSGANKIVEETQVQLGFRQEEHLQHLPPCGGLRERWK